MATEEGMSKKNGKPLKILIIDDEEDLCWILSQILCDEGYKVICAHNAQEAIVKIEKNKFDVAFIDIILPGKNGVEIYKEIKEISPTTTVVMITGHPGEKSFVKDAIKEGAFTCLFKPFGIKDVLNVIKKIKGEKD